MGLSANPFCVSRLFYSSLAVLHLLLNFHELMSYLQYLPGEHHTMKQRECEMLCVQMNYVAEVMKGTASRIPVLLPNIELGFELLKKRWLFLYVSVFLWGCSVRRINSNNFVRLPSTWSVIPIKPRKSYIHYTVCVFLFWASVWLYGSGNTPHTYYLLYDVEVSNKVHSTQCWKGIPIPKSKYRSSDITCYNSRSCTASWDFDRPMPSWAKRWVRVQHEMNMLHRSSMRFEYVTKQSSPEHIPRYTGIYVKRCRDATTQHLYAVHPTNLQLSSESLQS